MCIKTPKIPKAKDPAPAPKRSDTDTGSERRKLGDRSGVFGNILTSPLGDSTYGGSAQKLAVLGAN